MEGLLLILFLGIVAVMLTREVPDEGISEKGTEIFFEEDDPRDWTDYHGQNKLKRFIQLKLDVLRNTEGVKFMFIAPKGSGKTTLFRIVGRKIKEIRGGRYFELTPAILRSKKDVDELMRSLKPRDILCLDECFTPDMEILTEYGWERLDVLRGGDRVAQYREGKIEWVTPTGYVCKPHEGELRTFYGKWVDVTVTPRHEMLMKYPTGLRKVPAGEVPRGTRAGLVLAADPDYPVAELNPEELELVRGGSAHLLPLTEQDGARARAIIQRSPLTGSPEELDFLQTMAVIAGYRSVIHKDRLEVDPSANEVMVIQQVEITENYYRGLVYCVTVPSGNIVVRRNGRVNITGNCHMLPRRIADTLLPAIEDGVYPFPEGMKRLPEGVSWIGATTDVGMLPPAFRDRFHLLPLDPLEREDMVRVLRDMSYPINPTAAEQLALRSLGSPRELKRLYTVARDVAIQRSRSVITPEELEEVFDLLGLDENGLYPHDRMVLEALANNPKYYAVRANGYRPKRYAHSERAIRALTGLDDSMYRDEVEPKLLRTGLLTISSAGRELTDLALQKYFPNLQK